MRPRSNTFELWILASVLGLFIALHSIWNILFEEWLKQQLERALGLSVATMIERFGAIGVPTLLAMATVWLIYRYIRREFESELVSRTTPKLNGEFSETIPGCKVPTSLGGSIGADYFRIKVEIKDFGYLDGCQGRLVSIKKNGALLSAGEILTLPFAPADDPKATAKTIYLGVPEFLDVLSVTQYNQVIITTNGFVLPNSIDQTKLFSETGIYDLEVTLTAPATAPKNISLKFTWLGNRTTAKLEQVYG